MVDVPLYHFTETDFSAFQAGDKLPVMRDLAGNRRGGMIPAETLCAQAQAGMATALSTLNMQAKVVATNGAGRVTWTFAVPFGNGVVPVLSADVLATANQPYSVRKVSLDNTQVTLDILGAAIVSVLGINVLAGLTPVGAGIDVHIVARAPS